MNLRIELIGLGVFTLLMGCAASPKVPSLNEPSVLQLVNVDLLGAGETAIDEQKIFGLTSEQSAHFLTYFNDEKLADQAPVHGELVVTLESVYEIGYGNAVSNRSR